MVIPRDPQVPENVKVQYYLNYLNNSWVQGCHGNREPWQQRSEARLPLPSQHCGLWDAPTSSPWPCLSWAILFYTHLWESIPPKYWESDLNRKCVHISRQRLKYFLLKMETGCTGDSFYHSWKSDKLEFQPWISHLYVFWLGKLFALRVNSLIFKARTMRPWRIIKEED